MMHPAHSTDRTKSKVLRRRLLVNRVRHLAGPCLLADLLGTTCSGPLLAAPLRLPVLVDPASHEHHVGKVIFVELVTPDLAAAKRFYAGLFGWTFRDIQTAGGDYAEASLDGRPVAGLFHKDVPTGALRQPAWLSFIAVRDVDAARKIALENGARILVEPHTVSQRWQRWQARGTW